MYYRWFRLRSFISHYKSRYSTVLHRIYWVCIIMAVAAIFIIPITMGIRNPNAWLPDFHGAPPAEVMNDWNRIVTQSRREYSRINDFVVMVELLSANYPFFALAGEQMGIDYMELATEVFEELSEVARYEATSGFFANFLNDRYLSQLGGFGDVRITSESSDFPEWITEPYFFGHYDWRFYDDRFETPLMDGNVQGWLSEDTAHLQINSFLPKGYEPITRLPFWYFDFETDKQYLMDFYASVTDFDNLVIDIRGIGSGFGDYFLPLILEPLITQPLAVQFYAFHTDGLMARRISENFREWYDLGDTFQAEEFADGFSIPITAQPVGDVAFERQVWLLTDSANFSGPNFMYLQMAQDAGFIIVYEENPDAMGWETSFFRLPHSGLNVRFNPLYFTDADGRLLEMYGVQPTYRLSGAEDAIDEILSIVAARAN